ncbi:MULTISPECIES: hypothetical protein [unclassified Pseudomonas]|uniref:hypothetical protein n=1 Tax=unclassified Pseudomonas TaxID=196821 RepID=UPI000A1DC12C|nr:MULTISPECIES: hypothetical protein [unclassified Pseudomonas]
MALIECYECKRSISSQTSACIHCGAPLEHGAGGAEATKSPISFGRLPRNESVPEASIAPAAPAPQPRATPAAAGRRRRAQAAQPVEPQLNADGSRPVEGWLKIMVFLLPGFFVWFLLRSGHSAKQRLLGFGWLALLILASSLKPS